MNNFTIKNKEYELKLTYKALDILDGLYEGGSYELIGRAMQGDFGLFPRLIHAGLIHTGKGFTIKDVEKEIESLVDNQELTLDNIAKISDAVVVQSFFYKDTVERIMKDNPEMRKSLEKIRS